MVILQEDCDEDMNVLISDANSSTTVLLISDLSIDKDKNQSMFVYGL